MTMEKSAVDIARWAEARAATASDAPRPLSAVEKSQIALASRREGMTLPRLASAFARSEEEVATVLGSWVDTRAVAKHLIHVHAAELTNRMLTEADPVVALDILERVEVVRPKKGAADSGNVTLIMSGFKMYGLGPEPAAAVVEGDVLEPPALEGQE